LTTDPTSLTHACTLSLLLYISLSQTTPQEYLDTQLRKRGYSTKRYATLNSAYYKKPTDLQMASYNIYLINLVRNDDLETFQECMTCGLSPNACNSFGESLVHYVCRRSDAPFLQVLVNAGASCLVSDGHGRTPLHDACCSLDAVRILLQQDKQLLHMADARGYLPLEYVRPEHFAVWKVFLEAALDLYWPVIRSAGDDVPLVALQGGAIQLPDPSNALSLELATLVASGSMAPEEAKFLNPESTEDCYEFSNYDNNSSLESWDTDDDESSCCSEDSSWEEDDEAVGTLAYGKIDDSGTWEAHMSFLGALVLDEKETSTA
jgi:hypothetical protein